MIQVGQLIPMSLQLSDPATDRFVRCLVIDPAGAQAASANLVSRGLGLYSVSSVPMPDVASVVLQYRVFSDAGYSVPDPDYAMAAETVLRAAQAVVDVDVVGELTGLLVEA